MEGKPFRVAAVSGSVGSITTINTDKRVYIPLNTIIKIEEDETRFKKGYKHTKENVVKLHKKYSDEYCLCKANDIEDMMECVNDQFLYRISTKNHKYIIHPSENKRMRKHLTGKSGESSHKRYKPESESSSSSSDSE